MAKYVGAQPRVSGNRITGGTITTFSSTGIDDSASTQTNLTITDSQATLDPILVNTATTGSHTFDTDTFVIDTTNDRIGINVASPAHAVDIAGQVINVLHTDDGAGGAPTIILDRDSNSPAVDDQLATFCIKGRNDADESTIYAEMYGHIVDPTDGAEKGEFDFNVMAGGTLKSVMMLSPDEIIVNQDAAGLDFHVKGDTDANLFFANTVTSRVGIGTLTPEQKLHVVGDVKIDGTITFSDTASGAGAPTFTIKDEANAGSAAQARLNLEDSTSTVLGEVRLLDGDMVVGADDQLLLATDMNNSYGELKSTVMYAHKRLPEAVRVSASSNLTITPLSNPEYFSEQTACTITTSNSGDFSAFTVGDVVKIEGCTNAGNNQLTRLMSFSNNGDTMTVHGFRQAFTSESGGSITLSEGGGPCMHIPPYVNFTYATYPQDQNTSRVATMRYVRTAISELIDTSPASLDTLNELAAAINDDANFATTITNTFATKANVDLDNLSATGTEQIRDIIGPYVAGGTGTMQGAGNTITVTNDDANNQIDIDIVLNDPTVGVTLTGDITGSGTATMTDLQDVTVSFATSIANGVLGAASLDQTGSVTNLINGLPRVTTVQNNDDLIIADASDGFALKKLARSFVAPPALGEDLGFFAIAMS